MALAAQLLLVAGCGSAVEDASAKKTTDGATRVHGAGPYEVGTEIEPGVWTAEGTGSSCGGFTTSSRDFKIESTSAGYLNGSVTVGDVQRIVLHTGEFFTNHSCQTWQREDGTAARTPDPASLAGGCTILVADGDLVQNTLDFGHRPAAERDIRAGTTLQDRLFALVASRNPVLGDPAGQLVDYLDDPDAYNDGAGTTDTVTRAVDRIRASCAKV
ncbi:MAG: hypothetical protein ACJ716_03355 [Marmoricola sp.]